MSEKHDKLLKKYAKAQKIKYETIKVNFDKMTDHQRVNFIAQIEKALNGKDTDSDDKKE